MNAPLALPQDEVVHGGRLDAARKLYPQAPLPWVDLSTGVNPYAFPMPSLSSEIFARLPDDDAFSACESAARRAYRAPVGVEIVAGAGVQSFIQILPRVFPARRVGVLGFTYAEHAACWTKAGAQVETVAALDALGAFDVGIIVNPNNPDGRLIAPQDIAACAADHGGLLVVDESFMDFTPEQSIVPLGLENVVALRSFGKTYGLPGLRLGFALGAPALAISIRSALGPWAVSGPALAIGAAALADAIWREKAMQICARDAERLDVLLLQSGFNIVGGTSLFRLAAHSQTLRFFRQLAAQGVLTRPFAERPDWLRFGLPGDETAWARLARALASYG